ncbi:MAG TPA: ROK family protein, partial [Methylomirabilota bacterium]|nr:ROK family protein [Methylomirabilota bacterium]
GHLRRQNLERLLSIVIDQPGAFTRAALIEATGLSAPTVGSLVSHLMRSGIVRDLGAGPSRGGRRPSFMEFNARHGYIAAIDLGPTRTRLAVADLRGEMLAHDVVATPLKLAPEALLGKLAAALRRVMHDAHLPVERLVAVGAGAPGAVAWDTGVVTFAPNLGGWTHVPMRELLERELHVPVILENDVNLAILGERWRGAAKGHETCAYITVGTGIGAGIIVDGVLHRGHHFIAGEIAFMCMGPQYVDTRPHRCLESLASLKALAENGPRSHRDPTHFVDEALRAGPGDGRLRKAVEEAAVLIGIAVANLSVVVDPSLVVLAGALVAEGLPVVSEVQRIVGQVVPAPPQIVLSALGKEAPLWGCLLMAADEARSRLRHQLRAAAAAS